MYRSAYQSALLAQFEIRRTSAKSGYSNFTDPKPGNLKNQCLEALENWVEDGDLQIFRRHFGNKEGKEGYIAYIRQNDTGKFKALSELLFNPQKNASDLIFELLAVLLNFRPRPSSAYVIPPPEGIDNRDTLTELQLMPTVQSLGDENRETEQSGGVDFPEIYVPDEKTVDKDLDLVNRDDNDQDKPDSGKASGGKRWRERVLFYGAFLSMYILAGLGTYMINGTGDGCMIWNADHYNTIACDQPVGDAVVVPFDRDKMTHLKKVVHLDLITKSTFGAYWYSKINGQVEFFTAGGVHPVDTDRVLKPMTKYMFDKYIAGRNLLSAKNNQDQAR